MRAEFRRLTDVEIQQHCEKGLCYRLDEKFLSGHRRKRRELSVSVVQEDFDEENEIEEEFSRAEVSPMEEVSLNSIMGLTNPKTLSPRGSVRDQPMMVLIDLRPTHNFISRKLVEVLKIPDLRYN